MPITHFVGIDPGTTTGFAVIAADTSRRETKNALARFSERWLERVPGFFHAVTPEDAVAFDVLETPEETDRDRGRMNARRFARLSPYSSTLGRVIFRREHRSRLKLDRSEIGSFDGKPMLWAEEFRSGGALNEPAVARAIADRIESLIEFSPRGSAGVEVVFERFTNRKADASEAYLSPVRIRAGIEALLGVKCADSTPGEAKSTWTDARLSQLGLYIPGADHRRDATRIALMGLRRSQDGPLRIGFDD